MSNIRGVDIKSVATAAGKVAEDDAARQAALDQLRKNIDQTNKQAEQARLETVNAAKQLKEAQTRAKLANTNPGKTDTRPVTAAELARQAEQDSRAQLNDFLVNGDPNGPANTFTKVQTPRQVVETQVQTQQVVDRLGNQTSTAPIGVTVQYVQLDPKTNQVIGGHVGPPNQTSTVVNYHKDPQHDLRKQQELDQNTGTTCNVPANVIDPVTGKPSIHIATASSRAYHAKDATVDGAKNVVDIQDNTGVGFVSQQEIQNMQPVLAIEPITVNQHAANG